MAKSKDGKPANVAPRKATTPKAGPRSHGGGRNQGNNRPQNQIHVLNPKMSFSTGTGAKKAPNPQLEILSKQFSIILDMITEPSQKELRAGAEGLLKVFLQTSKGKGRTSRAIEGYKERHPDARRLQSIINVGAKALVAAQRIAFNNEPIDTVYDDIEASHKAYLERRQAYQQKPKKQLVAA